MPDIKNNDHIQLDPSFKAFIQAFLKDKGFSGEAKFQPLSGDGSVRDFYRIHSEEQGLSYIAMSNTPANTLIKKENMAYLMIGNHLFKTGISIPQIYRFDLANGWFILEDMGDRHLQDEANILRDRIPLYEKVLELLANPPLNENFRMRAKERAVKCFDKQLIIPQYEAFYEEILNQK